MRTVMKYRLTDERNTISGLHMMWETEEDTVIPQKGEVLDLDYELGHGQGRVIEIQDEVFPETPYKSSYRLIRLLLESC
jgi:uncharacterized protein YxjI